MLEIALKHHMEGGLPEAEALYRALLEESPGQPDALHYLGILLHQKGESEAGLELVGESLRLLPGRADWHNDLGNMLVGLGRFRQAAEAFLKAAELDPRDANFPNNLGSTFAKLGQYDDAESAFRQALTVDPGFSDALLNMGNLLESLDRKVEAAQYFCKAYVLEPTDQKPKSMLGIAYYTLGQIDDAARIYRLWMEEEPENPIPRHLYASCSGCEVPKRASDSYVEKTFDEFSEKFDVKMEQLSYQGHELVLKALSRHFQPEGKLSGLDAGCGTGLCGPLVRPYLSHLTGVDISSGMLEAAREKQVYDELVRMELTAYLEIHPGKFDLILSSDTLTYFGDLGEVLEGMRKVLKEGGMLIFTIEESKGANCMLNPHGRYSHGRDYIENALGEAGFEVLEVESGIMRFEFGSAVDCLAVTARAR